LEAHARGVFRLSEDRKPYVASADATYRRFFYGSEEDPLGVLGVGAFADLSDNVGAVGTENGASWDLGARAAFTHCFSRASSVAFGFEMATESRQDWRLLLTLRAAYGLAPADLALPY